MNVIPDLTPIEIDYYAFAKTHAKYDLAEKNTQEIKKNLDRRLNHIKTLNQELETTQRTWKGFIVKLLNEKSGILRLIHGLFLNFAWYASEVSDQNFNKRETKAQNALIHDTKLEYEKANGEYLLLKQEVDAARPKFNSRNYTMQFIMTIFGGEENFNRYPLMKLDHAEPDDRIPMTDPEHMPGPILRIEDKIGRRGIVIRIDGWTQLQTIHERYTDSASWVSNGYNFIGDSEMIISKGVVQEQAFKHFKELISKGQVTVPHTLPNHPAYVYTLA